ncbi:argininosuccinate synthase domain-containing protein [uncultured Marivirga sp.]|uniref:argininosuccinate synthase n=1 Tax=uncultured Marivirga sp. TaxID=1123707 RepID=UPI0030EF6D34|tara:strand:- start:243688 stop:244881 length:1194 start_codon:yes stop_codon:yes gene_type:complete
MKKVVLAYSGGLDTTFCGLYLSKELGYEVHAVLVNTGGFSPEELKAVDAKSNKLGIASFTVINRLEEFYQKVIKFLVFGNILKNQTYPLSVSTERIVQAQALALYAKAIGADAIAHGSTGAGNDQVRFDMIFQILMPEIEIITPIRDLKLSREEEIEFLKAQGVEMDFKKSKYSINKGIWGTSVGGAETLTSNQYLPDEAFPTPISKTEAEEISLTFKNGELIGLNDQEFAHPTEAIQTLEKIASPFGIGRDVHVGDTIIGIKGRVGFEAAAAIIVIKAHHLLEKHTLTKWQIFWKNQLSEFYGNHLHEGHYLDPVMRNIEAMFLDSQQSVSGKVYVKLKPEHFSLIGIESPHDLMSSKFGSYGEMNLAWTAEDAKGFTKILGNQTAIYHQINKTHG